jgi:hypothetical protein
LAGFQRVWSSSDPNIETWRKCVLHEQLRNAWHARERVIPISPAMQFASEGLILGAGTVVVAAEGSRRLRSLQGQEARVLALLSAAYGKAVAPSVVGNITRAAKAWYEGDDCLAYIHLAHARLGELDDAYDAAQRLFIVDGFMKVGTSPQAIFAALCLGEVYVQGIEKFFNPDEPRIPVGSGRTSGEWTNESDSDGQEANASTSPRASEYPTSGQSVSYYKPLPPALVKPTSWIGEIDAAQVAELGAYVERFVGPAGAAIAVFGLLFIPSPNNIRVDGEVSGIPGLRFWQNRDEALLHLTYDSPDGGQHTFAAYFHDDELRDEHGKVIGRVLPDGGVLIQSAVVSPNLAKDDEPRLCPAPGPDKKNELGREYESYVKSFVNPPPNTTPTGIGFQLPNVQESGALVYYDDCRHTTGMMADAKGPRYAVLLTYDQPMQSIVMEWWAEAGRQIAASDGRPVRWYFADLDAALFARKLFDFDDEDGGRARIQVVFLPWSSRDRR